MAYQIQISDEHPAQTWRPLSEPLVPIEAIQQIGDLKYKHDGSTLRLFDLKSGEQVGAVQYVESFMSGLLLRTKAATGSYEGKKQFLINLLNTHPTLDAVGKAMAIRGDTMQFHSVSSSTIRRWIKKLHIKKRRACLDCRWEYWDDGKVVGRIGPDEPVIEQQRMFGGD